MLKSLLFSDMEKIMVRLGEKPGRARVLAGWLYHDRCALVQTALGPAHRLLFTTRYYIYEFLHLLCLDFV